MEITAVTRMKGTRYKVEIDGEYWNILDAEVIAEFGLSPGTEVCEETLDRALKAAERRRARERAYYLISFRDHSAGELMEKLSKSVSEETALETVARMQELGLIDDRVYAEKLARHLLQVKRYGLYRARQAMREKKLSGEIIEEALETVLEETDPLNALRELVERRYAKQIGTPEGRRKTIAALMRYGHSYSDIRTVLSEYGEGPEEEE